MIADRAMICWGSGGCPPDGHGLEPTGKELRG